MKPTGYIIELWGKVHDRDYTGWTPGVLASYSQDGKQRTILIKGLHGGNITLFPSYTCAYDAVRRTIAYRIRMNEQKYKSKTESGLLKKRFRIRGAINS